MTSADTRIVTERVIWCDNRSHHHRTDHPRATLPSQRLTFASSSRCTECLAFVGSVRNLVVFHLTRRPAKPRMMTVAAAASSSSCNNDVSTCNSPTRRREDHAAVLRFAHRRSTVSDRVVSEILTPRSAPSGREPLVRRRVNELSPSECGGRTDVKWIALVSEHVRASATRGYHRRTNAVSANAEQSRCCRPDDAEEQFGRMDAC